jgi:hypothetical protein
MRSLRVKGQRIKILIFLKITKNSDLKTADILACNQIFRSLQYFSNEKKNFRRTYSEIGLFLREKYLFRRFFQQIIIKKNYRIFLVLKLA